MRYVFSLLFCKFFSFFNDFIYLFLVALSLCCYTQPFCSCGVQAYRCGDFSCRAQASVAMAHGVVASRPVGSSWTRDQTCVSGFGRWILYHWATREALQEFLKLRTFSLCLHFIVPTFYPCLWFSFSFF